MPNPEGINQYTGGSSGRSVHEALAGRSGWSPGHSQWEAKHESGGRVTRTGSTYTGHPNSAATKDFSSAHQAASYVENNAKTGASAWRDTKKDNDSASGGGEMYVPGLGGEQTKNPPSPLARRGRRLKNLKLDRVDLVHAPANPRARVRIYKGQLPSEELDMELEKAGFDPKAIQSRIKVKDGKFHAMHEDGEQVLGSFADRAGAVKRVAESLKKALTRSVSGVDHPASDFAYVPDPKTPSTWKLLIDTPAHVGGALAALGPGGFRGQKVQIPSGDLGAVKAKVKAAWLKAHPDQTAADLPPVLKSSDSVGGIMKNLEVIKAKLSPEVVKTLEELHETNPAAAELLATDLLAKSEPPQAPPAESVEKGEYAKLEKQLADEKSAREATEVRLAKMEAEAVRSGFVALAKADLEALGKAEDLGGILFEASSKMDPEVYKALEQTLKGAAAKLADTTLFKQLTQSGEAAEGVDEVTKLAKGLVEAGKYATVEAATVQVLTTHPELYRQYRDAR